MSASCIRNSYALLSKIDSEEERRVVRTIPKPTEIKKIAGRICGGAGTRQTCALGRGLFPFPPTGSAGKARSGCGAKPDVALKGLSDDVNAADLHNVELQKSIFCSSGLRARARLCWRRLWRVFCIMPFAIADATTLTEAGYVGEDVENIILRLLQNANYDVKRANAALFILTKLTRLRARRMVRALRGCVGRRRSAGIAENFGGHGGVGSPARRTQTSTTGIYPVNTTHILFICGGAFGGLDEIVRSRIGRKDLVSARN